MLSKFNLVQKVHLACNASDLKNLTIDGRRGQVDMSALRTFLGYHLVREVLLNFHSVKSGSLDAIQARLMWQIRLLEHPSRISISYWFADKEGKQAKRFRILFRSEHVPNQGYVLTTQSFRRGDES